MSTRRKSLIEEKYNGIEKRQMNIMKLVQERAAKMQITWVPSLPNDLMFQIFLLLPVKSLLRFTCVCKTWFKLIRCAEFVEAYNALAESSPIILRAINIERPNTFNVETQLSQSKNFCFFPCNLGLRRSKFMYFLEIENEKGKLLDLNISCYGSLVSSCNGLILISTMRELLKRHTHSLSDHPVVGSKQNPGSLIVMNPMTRRLIGFPVGTLPCGLRNESYGLLFSYTKGIYKVVHLFKEKFGSVACEILSLQTRSWKAVDVPVGIRFDKFGLAPIAAIGALHWIPGSVGYDYIVSVGADDEKFSMTDLPKAMGKYDRLVEMGGFLSFVNGLDKDHIEVWVLKGLVGTKWVKQHTIHINAVSWGYLNDEDDYMDVEEYGNVDDENNEGHGNLVYVNNAEHVDVGDEINGGHVNMGIEVNAEHNIGIEENEEHVNVGNEDDEDNEEHVNVGNVDIEEFGYLNNEDYSLSCFALNAKEMVFRRRDKLYVYDFELEEIREIQMDRGRIMADETIILHSNNLATWEPLEPMS